MANTLVKRIFTLALGLALFGSGTAFRASAAESTPEQVAYGAGSVLTTLVYAPFKATFCILGGVTSGLTLPFGGPQTAGKVATSASTIVRSTARSPSMNGGIAVRPSVVFS